MSWSKTNKEVRLEVSKDRRGNYKIMDQVTFFFLIFSIFEMVWMWVVYYIILLVGTGSSSLQVFELFIQYISWLLGNIDFDIFKTKCWRSHIALIHFLCLILNVTAFVNFVCNSELKNLSEDDKGTLNSLAFWFFFFEVSCFMLKKL